MSEIATCKKCGKEVYLFTGKTSGKRYYCDSDKYNDFHKCGQSRQETSTSPQKTLPLQSQQKAEKTENAVVSLELDEIHKEAVFACQKYLAGMFDNEKDEYKRLIWVMHYENVIAQTRIIKALEKRNV